jgi:hypothetical protein
LNFEYGLGNEVNGLLIKEKIEKQLDYIGKILMQFDHILLKKELIYAKI